MSHWSARAPLVWDDPDLDLFAADKFLVIDGGAAGEAFEPFSDVLETCTIYTFEVRGADEVDQPGQVNVDAGLWSHRTEATLHVARGPKASSIYPPNLLLLDRFPDRLGRETRETAELRTVALTSIDHEVATAVIQRPNFLKLDIHSAEYEALTGALGSLDRCLGVLVETWHAPIHAGQHLNGEVEALLSAQGFQLYDSHQASAWLHSRDGRTEATDRRQLVGSESLFLRDDAPPELVPWQIALFELFGYSMRALQICDAAIGAGCSGTPRLELMRTKLQQNQAARAVSQRQQSGKRRSRVMSESMEKETFAEQGRLSAEDLETLNTSTLDYIRSLSPAEISRRLDEVAVGRLDGDAALRRAKEILAREGVVVILDFLGSAALDAASASVADLKSQLVHASETANHETDTLLIQSAERVVTGYANLSKHAKAVANVRKGADAGMIDVFNFDRLSADRAAVLYEPFENPLLLSLLSDEDATLRAANLNLYLNRDITRTRGFHCDSYDRTVKGLCYVSDTTDLGFGPYCYVRRTHLDGPWRRANRKIAELAKASTEAPFVDPSMILPCVAPKGAIVLSDQSGVHRGLPQTPGHERQVLVMRYR